MQASINISELALQRKQYAHLSDDEWRWMLQQVEGRQRTADKLPAFATIDDWWYPVRLSCEQCSSEQAAQYKTTLLAYSPDSNASMADLTGGYGVDTFFLSEHFSHTDYIEQNAELCRIVQHNKEQWSSAQAHADTITVHNTTAEAFLSTAGQYDLLFLDPARRDSHGGKVFRLADCTPNVVELLPQLLQHLTPNGRLMLKLSPMLDITEALRNLTQGVHAEALCWDTHVVAIKNEVKEVLLISGGTGQITAIDLAKKEQAFSFNLKDSKDPKDLKSNLFITHYSLLKGSFLYEPNAAILKAGAYKLVAERFGMQKLDANTHLYASEQLVEDFPGRVWNITQIITGKANEKMLSGQMVNILCRNYPLTPDQLKKKLHLRDGGTAFVIGCRVAGKPTLFLADRFV